MNLFLIVILTVFVNNSNAQMKIIYPNVNEVGKKSFGYAVLKLALDSSGEDFDLNVSRTRVNNARIRKMIHQKIISIADFGTGAEFEQELLPIYFPIDLGLNGWRIFLIHKDKQSEFAKIKTIAGLKKMTAGQGNLWSDVKILENAGLKVYQVSSLTSLFRMTEKKRFDYFPLGANEVHSLLDQFQENCPNVIVEHNLLLIYPFGRLFFVHKDNRKLHDAVYSGLIKAFENGSLWKVFKSHASNKAIFTKANLKHRKQIFIKNPHMTTAFKKIPKKFFFQLNMLDEDR
jgi:hypothetical protein